VHVDASTVGDSDVYVAVGKPGGQVSLKRLFDGEDFPGQIDALGTANRKYVEGLGNQAEPLRRDQSSSFPLKADETAVIFTASDGLWDGYAGLQSAFKTEGPLDIQALESRMKGAISASVARGLDGSSGRSMAGTLVHDLLDVSRSNGIKNTDNLSATALTIPGSGPLPAPRVIGSIDGAGQVGPTEAMVDAMVSDVHKELGPTLLARNDNVAAQRLSGWRERRAGAPAPEPVPAPRRAP